jgi:hypothetical protein
VPATERFSNFGFGLSPTVFLLLIGSAGFLALWHLRLSGFFQPSNDFGLTGAAIVVALASVLALPAILIDFFSPFPKSLNVVLPDGLLFYPAIGLVAQTVCFVVPAAMVFGLTRHLAVTIITVALVETAFQVAFGMSEALSARDFLVAAQLFGISVVQVVLFRRHGFLVMFGFRLVYYLHWHILWGHLRLGLLF